MKRKVVVKVYPMTGNKSRSKALQIVVGVRGVESATLKENDQIEVTGEDIDAVAITMLLRKEVGSNCITKLLGKKVCSAEVVAVAPVEEKKPEKPKEQEPAIVQPWAWPSSGPYGPHYVQEINEPAGCSIM